MVLKLTNFVNRKSALKVAPNYKTTRTYLNSKLSELYQNKTDIEAARQNLAVISDILLNKAKNVKKKISTFMHKFFTEEGRSKQAGIKPLKDGDLEKFIKDTEIYDPSSPSYIHGDWCKPRKAVSHSSRTMDKLEIKSFDPNNKEAILESLKHEMPSHTNTKLQKSTKPPIM